MSSANASASSSGSPPHPSSNFFDAKSQLNQVALPVELKKILIELKEQNEKMAEHRDIDIIFAGHAKQITQIISQRYEAVRKAIPELADSKSEAIVTNRALIFDLLDAFVLLMRWLDYFAQGMGYLFCFRRSYGDSCGNRIVFENLLAVSSDLWKKFICAISLGWSLNQESIKSSIMEMNRLFRGASPQNSIALQSFLRTRGVNDLSLKIGQENEVQKRLRETPVANSDIKTFAGTSLVVGCGAEFKHDYHPADQCYSIDINKYVRPDLVCDFEMEVSETFLPSKRFKLVIFEFNPTNSEIALNNLARIMRSDGICAIPLGTYYGCEYSNQKIQKKITSSYKYINRATKGLGLDSLFLLASNSPINDQALNSLDKFAQPMLGVLAEQQEESPSCAVM
ncbi:MAG: hypothetical protein M1561_03960 [Gammaproteobacteria bacterium]|nr:hypothetical protein [Gammaproteobacteria bacterium]